MRCGNRLIQVGDSVTTVKALCGTPSAVQQGFAEHGQVPMETWTYDRGPDQFLMNIRIVNGLVVEITTLHTYGN